MAVEDYGYFCTLKDDSIESAKEKVVDALAKVGFGVLTEIDARATFNRKLGVPFRNYLILGACNPKLSLKALEAEPHAGLLMPCNVVLQDRSGADGVVVSLQNPAILSRLVDNPELATVAHEADALILQALKALGGIPPRKPELEDVTPLHPDQYPARGLKARLDARHDELADIREHYPSKGLEAAD